MEIRTTPLTLLDETLLNYRRAQDRLANLQEQAATGQRILTPSDDPVAAVSALAGHAQDLRLDAYLQNIQSASTSLNTSTSALQEAGSILASARDIALQGSQATNDAQSDEALAEQVDGIINRLLNVANTQDQGRYIFAGTASHTAPFVVTASDAQGRPLAVTYQGAADRAAITVGQGQAVGAFYPGSLAFQQRQRGPTVYHGTTGAAVGTGTDSATGQGTLTVAHTATSYATGSGVQAGASSAAGDTILGPAGAHTLTVNDTSGTGAAGTVSLDGGPAVSFTSADTDLKVTGPGGDVVYVNTTGITAGFNGTVDITAGGTLSVDGGASQVALDFSANQQVTDSATGAVTNVDSSNVRRTGTERLDYTGTADAFQVLLALRDDLRNKAGAAEPDRIQSISGLVGELDRVRTGVLNVLGEQSVSAQNLEALRQRTQDVQLEVQKLTTNLEGADIGQVVVNLQAQQNLLQVVLGSTARLYSQSLLDFLQ